MNQLFLAGILLCFIGGMWVAGEAAHYQNFWPLMIAVGVITVGATLVGMS